MVPATLSSKATLAARAFTAACGLLWLGTAAASEVRLHVDGPVETVFRWKQDGCPSDFIPDSPARAFRRPDGSVMLIAAHFRNGSFAGPSLDRLKPRCHASSGGAELDQPERFDDRFWVQGLAPLPKGGLFALVSHEYMGKRHPGRCLSASRPGPQCWYSAIVGATADAQGLSFSLEPPATRVVAAPPTRFDPGATARTGFFTATNIVEAGGWLYFVSWAEIPGTRGNCLFRAPSDSPAGPWRARRAGGFTGFFPSAYETGRDEHTTPTRCDVIGADRQLGILRSIVRLETVDLYVGVFSVANGMQRPAGIYYSLSPDLLTWGEARMLVDLRPWYGTMECAAFYDYPSLIDPASSSPTFATAGQHLQLYLTRFNWSTCDRGLDRDLVRLSIAVRTGAP
ncbi:hypothetical protein [Methylobacterium aerolatum]|uniref:DUF4185 domain-containing protein n=1 Tax=Methylobacterium aerolatum TaxID=418708 RepID=A0ABU0I2H4_9HYPH|nr:hypothetical protein [Methylobacterium aerolatum]MDQ0448808.1 hypothetical protein [Methylobacterium aerolatum]GJD34077.1 hypothetical protein FMGBMHLM_0973 [Methylobacterium aerolatum]